MFKKSVIAAALAAAAFLPSLSQAQTEGPWMVRVRALGMINSNSNSNNLLAPSEVELKNKVFPELDISYFITPNIATELVLTYPQKHDVTLGGETIGSLKHLPPTLLLQYHFLPQADFRPYVGAGLNYTWLSSVKLPAGISVDRKSFGGALQVGMDYKIAPKWFLNVDAKYVWIDTDVKLNGTTVTTLNVDPWLLSVGVGYRF